MKTANDAETLLNECYRAPKETAPEYYYKIEMALRKAPSNPNLWEALGIILTKVGRYANAVESLNKAIRFAESRNRYFNLAVAYAGLTDWSAVHKCVEKMKGEGKSFEDWLPACLDNEFDVEYGNLLSIVAELVIPNIPVASLYRAAYASAYGNDDAAIAKYQELLNRLPQDEDFHRAFCYSGLAKAHARKGNYESALKLFGALTEVCRSSLVVETAGELLRLFCQAREYEKASEVMFFALHERNDSKLLILKANTLAAIGETEDALRDYELCSKDPQYSALAYREMGQLQYLNGLQEEGIRNLHKALIFNDAEAGRILEEIAKIGNIQLPTEKASMDKGKIPQQASTNMLEGKSVREKIKEIIEIDLKGRMTKNQTASGPNKRKIQELFQQKFNKQLSNNSLRSYLSKLGYTKKNDYG